MRHTVLSLGKINEREVRPTKNFRVGLEERWCDYDKFQKLHMSYSHVIVTCKHAHDEYRNYIHLVYTLESVSNVYKGLFGELCNKTYWSSCHEPIICHDPEKKRNSKGRFISFHIHTEMYT